MDKQNNQKGFAALLITVLILALAFIITTSIAVLNFNEQKILQIVVKSSQSYFLAEAGAEDALLRLKKGLSWSSPYVIRLNSGTSTVAISDNIGGSRTITAEGNILGKKRKIQVVYTISTQKISFFYGAQVGDGGMSMGNNAKVEGNVYSNGSVTSAKGYITGSIVVARNGNRIEGLQITGNAESFSCKDSTIGGILTYVSGGSVVNCSASGSVQTKPNEIPAQNLPIPQSQIDAWKQDAQSGGTIAGDYTIPGGTTQNLGPIRITGNLVINNNATLNMRGTIWVVGNIRTNNGTTVKLDSASYGLNSGVLIADGKITVRPGTTLVGTGQTGSYLLLLSTNPELLDMNNPAIDIDNTAQGAIFYTSQGLIVLRNNVEAREITGFKIYLDNNAEVEYESGLENASFSSGPGGSWEVANWKEVE